MTREFRNVLQRFGKGDVNSCLGALSLIADVKVGRDLIFMSEDTWKFLNSLEALVKKSAGKILYRNLRKLALRRKGKLLENINFVFV